MLSALHGLSWWVTGVLCQNCSQETLQRVGLIFIGCCWTCSNSWSHSWEMPSWESRFASSNCTMLFLFAAHYKLKLQFFVSFVCSLTMQVHLLYRGTLRVLLVLLHDFPEFLCGYHFTFCDVIPPSCIQMRNIILSAFPRNMRLPDPSTPNLKVSYWL